MKTKNLVIIFIVLLILTSVSGLVVFLTNEKKQAVVSEQFITTEKQVEPVADKPAAATPEALKKVIKQDEVEAPEIVNQPAKEKIKAVMVVGGVQYEAEVKPGSTAYDLMNLLKAENKINFSGKNYSGLGFFVEEINGVKNNPTGENWLYYINGQPAQVGIFYYKLKDGDVIEWKYEKKSF